MAIQHANRGIVKNNLQLYYNREFSKSFPGEATSDISKPISISPQGGSLTVATTYPPFSEDMTVGNYFKNASNGGVLYHLVTNPALSDNVIYNNNGGLASSGGTPIPISGGTYLIFSFYVYLTQLYTGYNGSLGGYINVNTNGGTNGTVGSVLTSYGWSFYVNGVLDNAWSNNSAYLNKWVRVVAIVNNGAISASAKYFSSWYIYNDRLTGGSMYIAKFQIEQKSYVTRPIIYDVLTNTSNRGETTTNLISNPDFTSTSNWTGVTPWGTSTISVSTSGAKTYLTAVSTQNGNTPGILSDTISVSAGTVYTLSAYASRTAASAEAYLYVQNVSANSDLLWTGAALGTTEGWVVSKFTTPAGCTSIKVGILFSNPTIGNSFSVEKMQLEQREYQSAFVVGSRTANTVAGDGGLRDISGNNANADLTNVSFNSSGYTFNGSSNYIDLPASTFLDFNLNNFSIFTWINSSATANFGNIFNNFNTAGTLGFQFLTKPSNSGCRVWIGNVFHDNTVNVTNGSWNYIGFVRDGDYVYFYINGSLSSTGTGFAAKNATPDSGNDRRIGRQTTNTTYDFNGQISNFKIYSKALTAAEVLQNFNATRKTYGI